MKKIISIVLCLGLLLTGCSSSSKSNVWNDPEEQFIEVFHEFFNQDYMEIVNKVYGDEDCKELSSLTVNKLYEEGQKVVGINWYYSSGYAYSGSYGYYQGDSGYVYYYNDSTGTFGYLGTADFDATELYSTPLEMSIWSLDEDKTEVNGNTATFYLTYTGEDTESYLQLAVTLTDDSKLDTITSTYYSDADCTTYYGTQITEYEYVEEQEDFDTLSQKLESFNGQGLDVLSEYFPD